MRSVSFVLKDDRSLVCLETRRDLTRRGQGTQRFVGAAADYADVSLRALRRCIAQGRLTGYRVGPCLLKVDLDDADRLACPIPTARGPD